MPLARSRSSWLLVASLLLGGCTTFSAESLRLEPQTVSVRSAAPFQVASVLTGAGPLRFNLGGDGFDVDRDELSTRLAVLLADSLESSGVLLGPGGGKISIQVVYLDYMFPGSCLLDYTVVLGRRERFGLQAWGTNDENPRKACETAFERAPGQILGDARTIAYLGSR